MVTASSPARSQAYLYRFQRPCRHDRHTFRTLSGTENQACPITGRSTIMCQSGNVYLNGSSRVVALGSYWNPWTIKTGSVASVIRQSSSSRIAASRPAPLVAGHLARRLFGMVGMAQPLKIAHPIIAALFPRDDVIDVLGRLVAIVDAADRIAMQHQAAQLAPVVAIAALGGAATGLVIGATDLALVILAIAPVRQARAPGELTRPFRLEGHARQNGARRTPRFQV